MDAALRSLQGTWHAVRVETSAGPVPTDVARQPRYVFEGDRVTLFEGDRSTGVGTVALDPASSPIAIDVEMMEGPGRGQVALGVFEVTADRMRLCIGPKRPVGLVPEGVAALVELERVRG
jgi:uncharacterized protein (TIGR03067 family)